MAHSARLLQMLEPAVRPVTAPGAPRKPATAPFEQRGFDDLLAEFSQTTNDGTEVAEESSDKPAPPPRNPLAGISRIENASLRNLIAQQTQTNAQDTTPNRPAA